MSLKREVSNNQQKSKSPSRTRKSFFHWSGLTKKIITIVIIVACVIVLTYFACSIFFAKDDMSERKLEEMAKTYYEEFFYDDFVSNNTNEKNLDELMKNFANTGFAAIKLRFLLNYDDKKFGDYEQYFNSDSYKCDYSKTFVKIYPVAPYGKTNYRIEKTMSCNAE